MNFIYTDNFSAGYGNQLFVYFYGKIFENVHKIKYYHIGIPNMLIESNYQEINKNFKQIKIIKDFNFELEKNNFNDQINYNIIYQINPTIEDYKIFKPYISFLKDIYPIKDININKDDLVYHLRAGDYLFDNNHYLLNGDKLEKVIENIKYNNLFVVTNLKKFEELTLEDYIKYRNHYLKHGEHTDPYPEKSCVQEHDFVDVLNHINGVINVLNRLNCKWISNSVYEDFNYIRNFNKIIINVSTFSWWAAVLSNAEEVYVPSKWKWKKKNNKNLPDINLIGWNKVDL